MRVLCTGADGFLGANLCRLLQEHGHTVTGAALNRKGETSLDALGVKVRLEYGDVTDSAYVERLINAYEAEVIYHLAGVSIVRVAERDPGRAIRTNVLGTLAVCEAAAKVGARVLVASSDKAYGDHAGRAYGEDTPLCPTGAYEVSKAAADHVARLYGAVVVRAANLYGPGDLHWSRLVPNSCRLALAGKAPEVYGDAALYQREWLHVDDAARAYLLLAERGEPGQAYNVGSGEQASAAAVAQMIARLADAPVPELVDKERGFYEIHSQILNMRKIESLGWSPTWSLPAGLDQTLSWYAVHLRQPTGIRVVGYQDFPPQPYGDRLSESTLTAIRQGLAANARAGIVTP